MYKLCMRLLQTTTGRLSAVVAAVVVVVVVVVEDEEREEEGDEILCRLEGLDLMPSLDQIRDDDDDDDARGCCFSVRVSFFEFSSPFLGVGFSTSGVSHRIFGWVVVPESVFLTLEVTPRLLGFMLLLVVKVSVMVEGSFVIVSSPYVLLLFIGIFMTGDGVDANTAWWTHSYNSSSVRAFTSIFSVSSKKSDVLLLPSLIKLLVLLLLILEGISAEGSSFPLKGVVISSCPLAARSVHSFCPK